MTSRFGVLYAVGRNYVVLHDVGNQNYIVCDIYSVKFITFFSPDGESGYIFPFYRTNAASSDAAAEAQAQADQIIQDAEAQKQVRINEAEAEVARFNAMYEEYVKNPETTKMRMFYETMEDVLPGMKIVIDNGSGVEKILPLDSFSGDWKTEEDTSEETK